MDRVRFFISTIAPDAAEIARAAGMGLEIAEYCTAWNMDERFAETHAAVSEKLAGISGRALHAPFNELFPCAIDKKARALARERYLQAISLAKRYGADRVVIHGGYYERMYYPVWYIEQSIEFWRAFMADMKEDILVCLENVFEPGPDMLIDIVRAVNDERLGICLDTGHVNAYSPVPAREWLEKCAPYISHFHIHNNFGDRDAHLSPGEGTLPMRELLLRAGEICPSATFTLEVLEAAQPVRWLEYEGII